MIDHVVGHVVRRGMDAYSNASEDPAIDIPSIPTWSGVALIATTVLFLYALLNVEYTIGHVIATLTMLESPTAVLFAELPSEDSDAPPAYDDNLDNKDTKDTKDSSLGLLQPVEAELLIVKQKPITASFRTAMAALNKGGRMSRFRGLFLYVVHGLATGWMTSVLGALSIPRPVAAIVSAVVYSSLRMQWTHIVMAKSTGHWFKRNLTAEGISTFKVNALPTALLAICEQATVALPVFFFFSTGMDNYTPEVLQNMSCAERKAAVVKVFSLIMLCLFTAVAIVIPAQVTLARVQASMFSEEEQTVVPFDHTFNGKVVTRSEGGHGIVGIFDAWRTFGWAARGRLIALYIKVAIMQVSITMSYFAAVLAILVMSIKDEDKEKVVAMFGESFTALK